MFNCWSFLIRVSLHIEVPYFSEDGHVRQILHDLWIQIVGSNAHCFFIFWNTRTLRDVAQASSWPHFVTSPSWTVRISQPFLLQRAFCGPWTSTLDKNACEAFLQWNYRVGHRMSPLTWSVTVSLAKLQEHPWTWLFCIANSNSVTSLASRKPMRSHPQQLTSIRQQCWCIIFWKISKGALPNSASIQRWKTQWDEDSLSQISCCSIWFAQAVTEMMSCAMRPFSFTTHISQCATARRLLASTSTSPFPVSTCKTS